MDAQLQWAVAGESLVGQLADRLWQTEVKRTPIDPITDSRRHLTVQDAYAIQTVNVERRVAAGRVLRGRKVDLTSRAMQQLLGVDEPGTVVLSGGLTASVPLEQGSVVSAEFAGLGSVHVFT